MSQNSKNPRTVAEIPAAYQLHLPMRDVHQVPVVKQAESMGTALQHLLGGDLTFKGQKTNYGTHSIHAFAAKFPPQLPKLFISKLTNPGETVLDPMVGSGTTLVEAVLNGRRGLGVDIDPLAALISTVKSSTNANLRELSDAGIATIARAKTVYNNGDCERPASFDVEALRFFDYWFEQKTIRELTALTSAISEVTNPAARNFLRLVLSSIIITKSGSLTRARDLAHTRPHRDLNRNIEKSALEEFRHRLGEIVESLSTISDAPGTAEIIRGDARRLPLRSDTVDLVVTSPPYAANAIDYMRAHKFSLTWLGYNMEHLTALRRRYVGAELKAKSLEFPSDTANATLHSLFQNCQNRAAVVAHYFSDMQLVLTELLRVLKPGKAAIMVVGSSTIKGVDIKTHVVINELAISVGFKSAGIGIREILRDARMMPVSNKTNGNGIEARMHEEGVIGLIKK